jgi:MFS family permease
MNTPYEVALQKNIWKYTIAAVANKRIFVAIIGAYYLTIQGVTPQTIGLITLFASLSSFLFEIPSGYVSDKIGHKQALVVSRLLTLVSSICYFLANSVPMLIVAAVAMSIGFAFNSGTGSAFMHETLSELKRDHEYSAIMGKVSAIGFAVPVILTVLVPFLVSISYKIPFLIMAVVDCIGLAAVTSLTKPKMSQAHIEEVQASNFNQVMREAFRINYFTIAFFSGIVSAMLLSISAFRSPYQLYIGIPVIWFGVIVGIGRLLASLILANSRKIEKYLTLKSFFFIEYLIHTVIIFCLGLTQNAYLVTLLFIASSAFHWGLNKIDEGYQLKIMGKTKFKATLLSVGSQIESLLSAAFGFALGWIIERYSYPMGYMSVSLFCFVILTFLYVRMVKIYKGVI